MGAVLNSVADMTNLSLCVYIIGVVLLRLTMMSWNTHRRVWIIIYTCAGISASCYIYMLLENTPHWRWSALFGFIYTALWFCESRDRWLHSPPTYMSLNCAHLPKDTNLPDDCPLSQGNDHGSTPQT